MKINWPELTFGPVNLWVVIPAKEFYELMERYMTNQVTVGELQEIFSDALQSDLEHGIKLLNEKAAKEFHATYPALSKAISTLMAHEVDD